MHRKQACPPRNLQTVHVNANTTFSVAAYTPLESAAAEFRVFAASAAVTQPQRAHSVSYM
eukprot:CAMPEP_0174373608 /NCGR_PEP_ID=MMETSP0811_2-20130205/107854_1 /TAXON_ID=73025 ORGANISM="Eutreptiella gymnastica-like, Strain CCMP1594" /NCGR_SAMPLE_ID=MMETSP0811_2 /ASSEMBLY_ACC=CAM_ASM_000667 /LENGTH=59 /DNA_ID=CAMNT_0015522151 /DNA_START=379 /DNA_END=558 /DNA_ORIENTATION=+